MYKIGMDIGTTTIKCALFSDGLHCVAESSKEYPMYIQHGTWAHQSPDDWWNGVVDTIRSVLMQSGIDPKEVKGIGVSCQSPTMLPIDRDGNALHDAIIWMDRRADAECSELMQRLGAKRIFEITGNKMDSFNLAPKLLWFQRHHPELMQKTHMLLQANGYINYMLTNTFSIDRSNASVTLLYDIAKADWSDEILEVVGIIREILPPIYDGCDIIGSVCQRAAMETRLAVGTPVIAGTVDALAGAMEAGVISGGMAFEATGTSSVFLVMFDSIYTTPHFSMAVGLGTDKGTLYGAMNTTGASYKWFRDTFMGGENDDNTKYAQMDAITESKAPTPTKIVFLPYMAGERSPIWDSDARGAFFGLELATNQGQLMRAIMEGTSFALRDNIEAVAKAGVKIGKLRSVGGCCKSDFWLQIKASILNMPIEIPKATHGSPGGLALMLAVVTGEFHTVEEAASACVEVERVVEPVGSWVEHYNKMYLVYKNLYEHTKKDFAALSRLPG